MKNALITGITGQDGSYLAELLLEKGYNVYGLMRRKSVVDYGNVDHIKDKIHFIYADMQDIVSLISAMRISQADEVYNLAAQSFVATSWDTPCTTADIDAIGVTNMLEAMRIHLSIQEAHMEWQSFMDTGLLRIIEKVMICMPAQEFFSTTNQKDVVRNSLQERLLMQ